MQFIMKGGYKEELKQASPVKPQQQDAEMKEQDGDSKDDMELTDAALLLGFDELQPAHFYHPKLD